MDIKEMLAEIESNGWDMSAQYKLFELELGENDQPEKLDELTGTISEIVASLCPAGQYDINPWNDFSFVVEDMHGADVFHNWGVLDFNEKKK